MRYIFASLLLSMTSNLAAMGFHGDTLVLTLGGQVLLSDLHIGDEVLSFSENGESLVPKLKNVKNISSALTEGTVTITVEGEKITLDEHTKIFSASDKTWVAANRAFIGMVLLRSDGETATIDDILFDPGLDLIYSIEIEDNHTLFVGSSGIFVHNVPVNYKAKGICDVVCEVIHRMGCLSSAYVASKFNPAVGISYSAVCMVLEAAPSASCMRICMPHDEG